MMGGRFLFAMALMLAMAAPHAMAKSVDETGADGKAKRSGKVERRDRSVSPQVEIEILREDGIDAAWAGDLSLAEQKLGRAISMGGRDERLLVALSRVRMSMGDEEGAWEAGSDLLDIGSERNALAIANIGERLGKRDEILKRLSSRKDLESSEDFWVWMLSVLALDGKWDRVESLSESARGAHPSSWRIALLSAQSSAMTGKIRQAEAFLSEAGRMGGDAKKMANTKKMLLIMRLGDKDGGK